jgi:hypothetical protein
MSPWRQRDVDDVIQDLADARDEAEDPCARMSERQMTTINSVTQEPGISGCEMSGGGWSRLAVVGRILVAESGFRLRNAPSWCGCGHWWLSSPKTSRS